MSADRNETKSFKLILPANTEFSLPEVANLLELSQTTIRRYAKDGTLGSHKNHGGHFRFYQSDIDSFIQEHAMGQS